MGATKIAWTTYSFNSHIGCTKVPGAPECDRCYAETQDKFRHWTSDGWGVGKPRRRTSEANWRKPLKWDRDAAKAGVRERVFCNSLSDVFDQEVPDEWRDDLIELVRKTSWLDWQFLTKRPQAMLSYCRSRGLNSENLPQVWWGISTGTQARVDSQVPLLLKMRDMFPTSVLWLSIEPQLGPVSLLAFRGQIDWAVSGGESGSKARPFDLNWGLHLIDEADDGGYVPFMKQLGANPVFNGESFACKDRSGADPDEWPECLRVRRFPR